MSYTIKGNLDVTGNITSAGRNVVRSINNTNLADATNGNVNLQIKDLITGTEGDAIFFDNNNNAITAKTVKFARVVNTDQDLVLEKAIISAPNVIFDIKNNQVLTYNGSAWVVDTSGTQKLSIGYIYSNVNTGKAFFVNTASDIRLVSGSRVSQQTGNNIQVLSDGLFVGTQAKSNAVQYVDSVNGLDTNDGTIAKPLKTLKAALDKLIAGVKGYTIYLHSAGTYTIPYSYGMTGVGLTISNYPAPAWVDGYVSSHPEYEWMAAATTVRPTIKLDPASFINRPGLGWDIQGFVMTQFSELSVFGCLIDTGTIPSGTVWRNGIFGDANQSGKFTFQWCEIKLSGIRLLNERIESSSTVSMYRCLISTKTGKSFGTEYNVLQLSVSGEQNGSATVYPEHPYFNNSSLLLDIRNSVEGVTYFNGVPKNCTYSQLFGGPFP